MKRSAWNLLAVLLMLGSRFREVKISARPLFAYLSY